MGLLTMDDGIVNWGEHTEDEETNHALMAISSISMSAGYIGTSSKHSVDLESEISRVPQEVYVSKPITTNENGASAPKSKEVEPSCVTHIKTPRQPIKDQETPKVNRKNWNAIMERELGESYSFPKKKCFVCGSLSHLIKDCDYYEKKMAREVAPKKQSVFNTGNEVIKPVWNNADRINHANHFIPRSVILNYGRPNVNSVRPNVNTVRKNINSVRQNVNSVWSNVNTGSFNVNSVQPKQPVPTSTSSNFSSERPQGNWGSVVKTSAGYNWRPTRPNSNCNGANLFAQENKRIIHSRTYLSVLGKFDRKSDEMFDINYLTDSMNYIPVSLENQADPHAGTSEVTNSAGTSQTPNANAFEEKDEDAELIVVPPAVMNTAEKILAFRRELEAIALKHLGTVPENNSTSTPSVNSGSEPVNIGELGPDDSAMPELKVFHKSETGIFDEASYDEEGMVLVRSTTGMSKWYKMGPTEIKEIKKSVVKNSKNVPKGTRKEVLTMMRFFAPVARMELIRCRVYVLQTSKILFILITQRRFISGHSLYGCIKLLDLYATHQHSREAWIQESVIDKTLFIKRDKKEIVDQVKADFRMSSMGETYIFPRNPKSTEQRRNHQTQDKYVAEILKKFDLVTPKTSHLNAVKRIFKYLKGKPNLGLWYPRESPFDLEAFSDSDYGGSNLDRKSTTVKTRIVNLEKQLSKPNRLWEKLSSLRIEGECLGKDLNWYEDYAKRTWKLNRLKKLNFEEVKAEFENLVKQLDTYVPMKFEATKEKEKIEEDKDDKPTKKTGKRRKQIARKGFHTDHDKDEAKDSDEANDKDDSTSGTKIPINPVPVATKSPNIANYKIIKQGRKCVYQIVRENGTDMVYISFGEMLTDISIDDITELYTIVIKKHGMNEPEDEFENVLWEYLKNMFEEPLSTYLIWSLPGQQRIIYWRYYDACKVHCLNLESADVYMLIERKYPLCAEVCKAMLDKKL
ncbi:hypothetical protein Tco_1002281 [Tanacetum coccineum]|uniref:CCHC-type domain-containing protein n=1 Tax=Tanacetum coccineum TaxID=301880 RepID=A0ABQ5F771_9ASTR